MLKIGLITLLVFIFCSLFQALPSVINPNAKNKLTLFLGRRIFASLLLFLIILGLIFTGLIVPNPRPY